MDKVKYFNDIIELVKAEKKEEEKQFRRKMETSLDILSEKGYVWYPIEIKKIASGNDGNVRVSLKRKVKSEQYPKFKLGKPAKIYDVTHPKDCIVGVVEKISNNYMTLVFEDEDLIVLPEWLDYALVAVALTFDQLGYKKIDETLKRAKQLVARNNTHLIDVFLGAEISKPKENINFQKVSELNESQNKAIEEVLKTKDIAIIHGPPGTGKTTTMVEAIKKSCNYYGEKILVTAPSNAAVDMLTERLAEKGLKVLRIGNTQRINKKALKYTLDNQIENHEDYPFLKLLKDQADILFQMLKTPKRNKIRLELISIKKDIKELKKLIVSDVIKKSQIVTTTLAGSLYDDIKKVDFPLVFIDEAAQALEPRCWMPILRKSTKKVILAGDHFQLPPVVKSNYPEDTNGLDKTLFEKVIEKTQIATLLKTQYRMHDDIMQFSNKKFYSEKLFSDDSVRKQTLIMNLEQDGNYEILAKINKPMEFIDTCDMEYYEETKEGTNSKFNYEEAKALISYIESLFKEVKSIDDKTLRSVTLGIITPYREQINKLKELLEENDYLFKFKKQIEINTVDGFQGQERDIICISMVRSNMKHELGFLRELRRMNVAVTRAKKKLIIIGDGKTLTNNTLDIRKGSENLLKDPYIFFRNLINHIKDNEGYTSVQFI
jgi:superfamily I DNA and/or RNA helicase